MAHSGSSLAQQLAHLTSTQDRTIGEDGVAKKKTQIGGEDTSWALVSRIVARVAHCDPSEITAEYPLTSAGGIGFLERVELSLRLEEATGLLLADDDTFTFRTAGEIADYIDAAQHH